MAKKLITVMWSYTVEADIPDGTTTHDLDGSLLGNSIEIEAFENISCKDGMITYIEDI